MHTCINMNVYTYKYTHTHSVLTTLNTPHVYVYLLCMGHTLGHIHTHTCMYACIHIHTDVYTYIYIERYIYIYICTIHTRYSHTFMCARPFSEMTRAPSSESPQGPAGRFARRPSIFGGGLGSSLRGREGPLLG